MIICTKCVLPETYPKIIFDENGICNVCKRFDTHYKNIDYKARQQELEKIIEKTKNKKREYDCIVPVSGGRDSSMVLYMAVKVFKLKTLALTYDNGFTSTQAKENLENLTRSLNVDFISFKPRIDILMKAYRTAFLKTGDFCIPCNRGVTTIVYKTALRNKIPLILLGYCSKTDYIPPEIERFDQRLFKDITKNEMTDEELKPFVFPQIQRLLVTRINVPDYFDWRETENFKKLSEEITGTNYSGDVHFDCIATPVADYLKRMKWGFGKKELKMAVYIRDGLMSRDEALAQLPTKIEEPEILDYWLKQLNVTREDVARARDLSFKNFKSYNLRLLKILSKYTKLVSFPLEEDEN